MPNIPTRDGGFVFIADQDQANQRYQQEWGEQTAAKPAAAPKPQAKQTQQPKQTASQSAADLQAEFKGRPRQPAVGDYLTVGGVKKQYAGPDYGFQTPSSFEKVKKAGKTSKQFDLGAFLQTAGLDLGRVLGSVQNPSAAAAGVSQREYNLPKVADQLQAQEQQVGKNLTRIIGGTAQKIVNDPLAAVQQLGAVSGGFENPAAAMAGVSMGEQNIPQVEAQRLKQAQAAREALNKTGKDPEGFSYGIRPNTPIIGTFLSEEGEFKQKYLTPKSALGRLSSSVLAAMGFDLGVSKLLKAPSAMGKTIEFGDKFVDIWKTKDIKKGLQMMTQYLIKDVAPNAIQDAMFFMPQAPAAMQKDLEKIRQLQTPEERIATANVLRATSQEEFNYAYEQFKNVAGGAATMTAMRGTLWAANRFLSKTTSGVPVEKAMDEAADEAVPIVQASVLRDGPERANDLREERLGTVQAEMYRKIEQNVAEVSKLGRGGAEAVLTKRQELLPKIQQAQQELDSIPDVAPQRATVDAQIAALESDLKVSTPEQLAAKQAMLEDRLASYEQAIARDPQWASKSTGTGKRASKNSTKLRMATETAQRLQQLEELKLQRDQLVASDLTVTAKAAEVARLAVESEQSTIGFRNAVNDARILVDAINKLDTERIQLLESRNAQLFQMNRLSEINTDYSLQDAYGQAFGELKDIMNAAEAAISSNNLNDDFMRLFVDRVDQIQNKIIDNGGLAPITPEFPEGMMPDPWTPAGAPEAVDQSVQIPKAPAPVQNVVPLTKTDEGEIRIDTDALAERQAVTAPPADEVAYSPKQIIDENNKDLGINQNPTESQETLDDYLKGLDEVMDKQRQLIYSDAADGTYLAEDATKIYSTNARKYTSSMENAQLLKAAVDRLDARKKILPEQYGIAIRKLATLLGGDGDSVRKIAALTEAAEFGKYIQNNLNKIMVPVAVIDDITMATMRSIRNIREITKGGEVGGLTREGAYANFADHYKELMAGTRALNELFYGVGNALRQFDQRNALKFSTKSPEELFSRFNEELATLGDSTEFADSLSKAARGAAEEMDETIGQFFKKVKNGEDLTPEELDGLENLVEKVYQSQGDLEKLKELEITGDAVLARLQVGSVLSNPAMIASIPIQGIPETAMQLMGMTISNGLTGTAAKFLGKTAVAKESFQQAKWAADVLLQTRFVIGEALDATYNRFVYGKSISDPTAAAQSAYELKNSTSLRREEAIAQDLSATSIKTPFFNYVLERSGEDDKIFDVLNKSRVLTKVFHDYFMPAEAWSKRSNLGKGVGLTTTALRGMGVGAKSYYPGGENVNLTIFNQLSATADELSTALYANASVRARVVNEVDEQIAAKMIDPADRAKVIGEKLNKEASEMYKPIKAGFDQKTIGYSVMDNQILELTRAVNLTEELTGAGNDIAAMANALKESKSGPLRFFARDILPIITSPINGIKRAVMIAYGGEIIQAGTDVVRATGSSIVKGLPEQVTELLPPKFRQEVIDFESKYMSSDPILRSKAQGALALSVGINSIAWFLVRDANQNITGGLENTYREAEGAVEPYTWNIGGVSVPYRYLPVIGNTLAFHATIRDFQEFAPSKDTSGFAALVASSLANTILDTPSIAGFDKLITALKSASTGDASRLKRLLATSVAKAGDPYLNLRKVATESFDPRKPASPTSRFVGNAGKFYQRGKIGDKNVTIEGLQNSIVDTALGTFGVAGEYTGVGVIADALVSVLASDAEFRTSSRKALWYGKPGEAVSASHAGIWQPFKAVLGRYWVFPDKLEDPLAKEMVYNLISPPRNTLFHSDGVGINDTVLNDFNHFLNKEFEFYDPISQKNFKGAYGYLSKLVTSKAYTQYPGVDSPFKMGPFGLVQDANWNREDNMRRVILKSEVDKLIGIAKEQFLMGELPGQQYKAPPEMKQMILNNRMGISQ
jgi:hypothetical protein